MVLSLAACALLLRGRRDARALIAGAIVLGIAAGFRPQNLIIAFVPLLLAFRARPRLAILGLSLTALIVLASYGGAAAASGGWKEYGTVLAEHERYIRETDSFLSPIRPSLVRVADDFFLRPFRAPAINIVLVLFAVIALVRRRSHTWLAVAIFAPFAIFAWLYLDFHSTSRFSIAYMPLFAILAAEGLDALRRLRVAGVAALLMLMIAWTWPALWIVHRTASPPVAALESVRGKLVYVDPRLGAHAAVLLRDFRDVNLFPKQHDGVLLREGPGAVNFTRARARLAGIARDRYFEVSVTP
jgi:hypothetical protein